MPNDNPIRPYGIAILNRELHDPHVAEFCRLDSADVTGEEQTGQLALPKMRIIFWRIRFQR
jgi:hypothetical protein